MDEIERAAIRAEGLDPDDPAVVGGDRLGSLGTVDALAGSRDVEIANQLSALAGQCSDRAQGDT
jgi:hypothetical protein